MLKAYTFLTICVVVWGSKFIFGKILVQDFSPTLLSSIINNRPLNFDESAIYVLYIKMYPIIVLMYFYPHIFQLLVLPLLVIRFPLICLNKVLVLF